MEIIGSTEIIGLVIATLEGRNNSMQGKSADRLGFLGFFS
jgi:hypothetical protein